MATRTGVGTLRTLLRAICKLVANFPGVLTNPDVPVEIKTAVAALIAVCLVSTFDQPHEGEISSS